jgi:carboxyl-terminal processing protease
MEERLQENLSKSTKESGFGLALLQDSNSKQAHHDAAKTSIDGNQTRVSCDEIPTFRSIIDTVVEQAYDTKNAIELKKQRSSFICVQGSSQDAVEKANQALLIFDDPFMKVLSKQDQDREANQREGQENGPGISIDVSMSSTKTSGETKPTFLISQIVPGSPGEKAGLKLGDTIVQVNGKAIGDYSIAQLEGLLTGQPGDSLRFKVKRGGQSLDKDLALEPFTPPRVIDRKLESNFAYLQLRNFQGDDLVAKMQEALGRHSKSSGLVLDLRNNPGGSFDSAVKIAQMFIDEGTIVETKIRQPSDPENPIFANSVYGVTNENEVISGTEFSSKPREVTDLLRGRPLVILVNEYSASSSEVLTGALKGRDNVVVMGTKTFGKGAGQMNTVPSEEGTGMHYTQMRFFDRFNFSPGDGGKNRYGIAPDLEIPRQTYTAKVPDAQLKNAIEVLKLLRK